MASPVIGSEGAGTGRGLKPPLPESKTGHLKFKWDRQLRNFATNLLKLLNPIRKLLVFELQGDCDGYEYSMTNHTWTKCRGRLCIAGLTIQMCNFAAAEGININGELFSSSYAVNGTLLSTNTIGYSVVLLPNAWNIKATNHAIAAKHNDDVPYYELAFDGRDTFSVVHVSQAAASKSATSRAKNITTVAKVQEDQFPPRVDHFLTIVWLAYASHAFWPKADKVLVQNFLPRSLASDRLSFRHSNNTRAPYLPKTIDLLSAFPGITSRSDNSQITATKGVQYLRGRLEATTWEEVNGLSLPSQFTFLTFDNPISSMGVRTNAIINSVSNRINSILVSGVTKASDLRPQLPHGAFITDPRFAKKDGALYYFQTNKPWLDRSGATLATDIIQVKQQMAANRSANLRKQQFSRIGVLLVALAMLSCFSIWAVKRLQNMSKANK
jgi:hypothetical protein